MFLSHMKVENVLITSFLVQEFFLSLQRLRYICNLFQHQGVNSVNQQILI